MNSPEESPFAAFATPKRGAVEEWRERQQQERAVRRKALRGLVCAVVGSACGVAVALALVVRLDSLLPALLGAAAGGVLGLGVGVGIGLAGFALMSMPGTWGKLGFEAELARRDPMSVIKLLVVAGSLIGITLGSAEGGLKGLTWGGHPQPSDSLLLGAFIGSLVGTAVLGLVWLAWEARRKPGMALPQAVGGEPQPAAPPPSQELPEEGVPSGAPLDGPAPAATEEQRPFALEDLRDEIQEIRPDEEEGSFVSHDLDVTSSDSPRPFAPPRKTSRRTIVESFLAVMAIFSLGLLIVGLAVEWPFWSLYCTGSRADAQITHHEERIVALVHGSYPLIETGLHYAFTDETGQAREGWVWLREGEEQWPPGSVLRVMYAPSHPATSMPATLAFFWSYDQVWPLMLILDGVGLIGFVGCVYGAVWVRKRRLMRWRFLQAAAAAEAREHGPEEEISLEIRP